MNLHESLQASQGLPEFSFSAGNVGTRPASDALVTFSAKGQFKIMPPASPHDRDNDDDDESQENSKPYDLPSPPSPPSGRWMSALQGLDDLMISFRGMQRDPHEAVISHEMDNFPRPFLPKPHDPNAFYYKPKRPLLPVVEFSLECQQWRHGIEPEVFVGNVYLDEGATEISGVLECRNPCGKSNADRSEDCPGSHSKMWQISLRDRKWDD